MSCAKGCCGSQGEHYRGVALSPPTPALSAAKRKDRTFSADMGAYRRLRESNVQPRNVNGSALMESRATTEYEINAGQILPDRRSVRLAESVLGDINP